MSDLATDGDEAVLRRRRFLRGSALMAAAAGGAVAATAGGVLPASATPVPQYAVTVGIPPVRLFDTRSRTGQVVGSSPNALTGRNRLRKGSWIDVAIAPTSSILLVSVFVNLTSYSSLKAGSLLVTPPADDEPGPWTLTHAKNQTVSNSAIVGILSAFPAGRGQEYSVARIFASATTHVSLDVTGASLVYSEPVRTTPDAQAKQLVAAFRSVHR